MSTINLIEEIDEQDFEDFLQEEIEQYDTAQGLWSLGNVSGKDPVCVYLRKSTHLSNPIVLGTWAVEKGKAQVPPVRLGSRVEAFDKAITEKCSKECGGFAPVFPDQALEIWQNLG